jgi:hypothetical protein
MSREATGPRERVCARSRVCSSRCVLCLCAEGLFSGIALGAVWEPAGLPSASTVYIGFAVADGRWLVIAVETNVAALFVIVAAAAITESPWLLVVGLAGHGLKDFWQHRREFVANTRWWPPFCLVVDWVAATVIAVEIVAGVQFHN